MVPSLDTAHTTLALSTIEESPSTGQRDPRTRDGATTTATRPNGPPAVTVEVYASGPGPPS